MWVWSGAVLHHISVVVGWWLEARRRAGGEWVFAQGSSCLCRAEAKQEALSGPQGRREWRYGYGMAYEGEAGGEQGQGCSRVVRCGAWGRQRGVGRAGAGDARPLLAYGALPGIRLNGNQAACRG